MMVLGDARKTLQSIVERAHAPDQSLGRTDRSLVSSVARPRARFDRRDWKLSN